MHMNLHIVLQFVCVLCAFTDATLCPRTYCVEFMIEYLLRFCRGLVLFAQNCGIELLYYFYWFFACICGI